jgi:hypothetical protein
MARLANTLLGQEAEATYALAPMVDPRQGAQDGFQIDVGAYVSNAAYVKRNLIVLLLEAPAGFPDLDSTGTLVGTLKAAFEQHAQSWEGLNQTLTAEFNETPVGGAGEMQQDLTNMTRARSEPQMTLPEKYGKPFSYMYRLWMNGIMMDPISKFPDVVTTASKPTDLLPDYMAASAIFIEPDPTHTYPVEAWLITNMMPTGSGDITGRRDLTQAHEVPQLSITFTGIQQVGAGVLQFAQQLMDAINLTGANPNTRPAFLTAVDADVSAQQVGYGDAITAADAVGVVVPSPTAAGATASSAG